MIIMPGPFAGWLATQDVTKQKLWEKYYQDIIDYVAELPVSNCASSIATDDIKIGDKLIWRDKKNKEIYSIISVVEITEEGSVYGKTVEGEDFGAFTRKPFKLNLPAWNYFEEQSLIVAALKHNILPCSVNHNSNKLNMDKETK